MSPPEEKRHVTVVTACMTRTGLPAFAVNQVEVSPEEYDNGLHYYFAEADLLEAGYEEPFLHFPDRESPSFLHPAVRQYLGMPPWVVHRNPSENRRPPDGPRHRSDCLAAG